MSFSALQIQLEHWVGQVCEIYRTSAAAPMTFSSVIATTNELVKKHLACSTVAANDRAPLLALPAWNLRYILLHLDTNAILALSSSCRRLRSLALQSPGAWSSLNLIRPTRSMDRERALIGRSFPMPLKLSFSILRDDPPDFTWTAKFLRLLLATLPRLRSLYMSPNRVKRLPGSPRPGPMQPSEWSQMLDVLAVPAPILSQIRLSAPDPITQELNSDLFARDAPALVTCFLWGVILPPAGCPALSNLTTLHVHSRSVMNSVPTMTLNSMANLLDMMPKMVTLCLEGHRLLPPSHSSPDEIVSVNKSLRNVSLRHVERSVFTQAHTFLENIGVRDFSYNLTPSWPRAHAMDPKWTLDRLAVHFPRTTSLSLNSSSVELVDLAQPFPIHLRVRLGAAFFVLNTSFDLSYLTHMTIGEFELLQKAGCLPEMPHLTTLRVLLAACSRHRIVYRDDDGLAWTGIFVHNWHAWACPSLCNVHIAHCPPPGAAKTYKQPASAMSGASGDDSEYSTQCYCAGPLTISLREVHRFLVSFVQYERDRLEEIRLTGVEPIDPDIESMMERLYELADELVITSVPEIVTSQDPIDCSSCAKSFL